MKIPVCKFNSTKAELEEIEIAKERNRIEVTEVDCFSGPQETIEIPYDLDFIDNLKPTTFTSYYIVKIYKDDKLITSYRADYLETRKLLIIKNNG